MAEPSCKLSNGAIMPSFGYGTWLSEPGVVGNGVKIALENGYRHIDCAHCYENEAEVGVTFKAVFKDEKKIKREDVFVTSKLWVKDFGDVKAACRTTLSNLCLDYLDLYLIHLPFEVESTLPTGVPMEKGVGLIGYTPERIQFVWKCMEELVDEGLVRAIGISNFTIKKTEALLNSSPRIKPACNQCELHPYLPQQRLLDYCKGKDIAMVAYSPLANPGRPATFKKDDEKPLLDDELIKTIANKHKATPAQVLVAWSLTRHAGVLVKSVSENRILENMASLNVKLDEEDIKNINNIQHRYRFCKQEWALKIHEEAEDLWDGEMLG